MIASIFFLALAACCAYTVSTEKHALVLLLFIGFTQDAVRKLTPGEPVYFIIMVGLLFGAILIGIWIRKGFFGSLAPFLQWTDQIRAPLMLFVVILFLQLVYSVIAYGNVIVGLIGLTTYTAPFLALIVGYSLVNSVDDVRDFLRLYVIVGTLVSLSVLASFMGYDWRILNEVGAGLKIYDQGTVLKSHAGIMRTGEIAAWHISTTACLFIALALSSQKTRNLFVVILVVALLVVTVALTGRRKMLMVTSLFILIVFTAIPYYRKVLTGKYFFNLIVLLSVGWGAAELASLDDYSDSLRNYIARGSSVFSDATGRFVKMGIDPIQWAYNRVGLLGGGLGIASQGSFLFNVSNVAGGSGEGGLGKIMVELGIQGLFTIFWLMIVLARHVNQSLKLAGLPDVDPRLLPLMVSLGVMLAVNALTFSVATQLYGDIFVLVMLGLFGGFIFALPKIAIQSIEQRRLMRNQLMAQKQSVNEGLPIQVSS